LVDLFELYDDARTSNFKSVKSYLLFIVILHVGFYLYHYTPSTLI